MKSEEFSGQKERIATSLAIAFIGAKLFMLLLMAYNSQYVMDEYHQGNHPTFIKLGYYDGFTPRKTVLYSYLYNLAHMAADNTVTVMTLSRGFTFLIGLGIIYFIYLIARSIGRNRLESLLTLCLLLAFSTFMERVFRVRAEPLSLLFATAALYFLVKDLKLSTGRIFVAGTLAGCAFLTTQKAIYFDVALGLALIGEALSRRNYKEAITNPALLVAGWVAVFLLYAIYFRGAAFYEVIWAVYERPLSLALHGGAFYQNLYEFIYQTLYRNAIYYLLCVAGLLVAIASFGKANTPRKIALIFSAFITFFIYNHNLPWPYIFIMAIPFLSLWGVELFSLAKGWREGAAPVFAIAIIIVSSWSFVRNVNYLGNTNVVQNSVANQAYSLLGPDDNYFDATCMVVNRVNANNVWWSGRELASSRKKIKEGDKSQIEGIFADQPKLIIFNYRISAMWDILEPYIRDSYLRITSNIFLSGATVTGDETVFTNRWEGEFHLYTKGGKKSADHFYLNGKKVSGSVSIKTGIQKVKLGGGNELLLLPDKIPFSFKVPPSRPIKLFSRYYNY